MGQLMDRFWESFDGLSYNQFIIWSLILVAVTAIIQIYLNSLFKKYSGIGNSRGMTGAQAARAILDAYGIYDVDVQMISGNLSDNYNPRTKILSLSQAVYNGASVAAVGVAAHEAGHAIQHSKGYIPVKLRTALAPVASIGSRFSWFAIVIGLFISAYAEYSDIGYYFALAGLVLFLFAVLFSIVTLPVEFNASRRAKKVLSETLAMQNEDLIGVRKVLGAAAMTYVASLASSILSLVRMLSIISRTRHR